MKLHFLMALSVPLTLQVGLYSQPQQTQAQQPHLEVQMQRLPSSNEGTYFDNSGAPQRSFIDNRGAPRRNGPNRPYPNDPRNRYADDRTNGQGYYDSDQAAGRNSYEADEGEDYQEQREGRGYSQTATSNRRNSQAQPAPRFDHPENARPTNGQQRPAGVERTLSIIKPDAVRNNHIGDIISRFEQSGLRIAAIKMTTLSKDQAGRFYQVHRDRPFYRDLVEFMSSGPVVIIVLEGDQAIAKNREIMGATDPKKADKGTLRADFAESVTENAVHGSDSPETAQEEIFFFFRPNELPRR